MNATMLLSLYPRSWRARYEPEFRAMLEDHPPTAAQAMDIVLGAIDAHLHAGPRPATAPPPDPVASARRREAMQAIFFAHLALFTAVISLVALVNIFFTSGQWWALYPLWGWGTLLAMHAGITWPWKGLLGAHLAVYLGLNAGLVGINIAQGGPPWAIWPILALGVPLAAHALIATRGMPWIHAHALATTLGTGVLALVAIVTGGAALTGIVSGIALLGILLAAHWMMRNRGWGLLRAHAFIFVTSMVLLFLNNLADSPGTWWVQYPLAMWTVLLVGHALIARRRRRWSGGWEQAMLEELGAQGERERQRRLVSTFWTHIYVFLAATTGFVLLDVLGGAGSWAAWPIGVWYVLLAFHAGYVLMPRRWIGSLLFGWAAASVGLVAIDLASGGGTWWYWPVMWSGVAVALLGGALWTRRRPWVGMHIAGGLALILTLVVTDIVTGPPAWWFYPVAAIILSWLVHFVATMDLARMIGNSSGAGR